MFSQKRVGEQGSSAASRPGSAAGSRPGSAAGKARSPAAFLGEEEGFGDNTRAGKAWRLREMLRGAQEMTRDHQRSDRYPYG